MQRRQHARRINLEALTPAIRWITCKVAAIKRRAVEVPVGGLNQTGEGSGAVSALETVKRRQHASGGDSEYRPAVRILGTPVAPGRRSPIEIPVSALDQRSVRFAAVVTLTL